MCAAQLAPKICMFMCQKPCIQKCVMASPVPREFELMSEPAYPVSPFADEMFTPQTRLGCMPSGCMMDSAVPPMIDP
ncbi:unnamed protein product [Strongylus vulgaris]|uniref:Uncharacterized protein n=1 Tax=Strongylus vulgaris TaxID=40348 RepID=A0A3P7IN83_STRVU|nr:unnamed protein product [Strongylus vulgaris]